jgi:hypothetical protein
MNTVRRNDRIIFACLLTLILATGLVGASFATRDSFTTSPEWHSIIPAFPFHLSENVHPIFAETVPFGKPMDPNTPTLPANSGSSLDSTYPGDSVFGTSWIGKFPYFPDSAFPNYAETTIACGSGRCGSPIGEAEIPWALVEDIQRPAWITPG